LYRVKHKFNFKTKGKNKIQRLLQDFFSRIVKVV